MDIEKEGELFEHWWENEGQYHRAGGNEYCKTFAWESWIFAKAQAVLDGFVVVPEEPTERMLDSAYSSISDNLHYADLENIYKAMIWSAQEPAND